MEVTRDILEKPIEILHLGDSKGANAAFAAFRKKDMTCLGDLVTFTTNENALRVLPLVVLPGIGPQTYRGIQEILKDMGIPIEVNEYPKRRIIPAKRALAAEEIAAFREFKAQRPNRITEPFF